MNIEEYRASLCCVIEIGLSHDPVGIAEVIHEFKIVVRIKRVLKKKEQEDKIDSLECCGPLANFSFVPLKCVFWFVRFTSEKSGLSIFYCK